ncbi:unnamed protein product [Musa banksii]
MMALIPVNCWKTCITMAITNYGRLLLFMRFLKGCFTCRAISQACSISSYSASTLSVPRIFFNMAKPSISISRSMRLVGVSAITMEPKQSIIAGTPAKPSASLHPQGWILDTK